MSNQDVYSRFARMDMPAQLRPVMMSAAMALDAMLLDGREKACAITHMQEVVMWANLSDSEARIAEEHSMQNGAHCRACDIRPHDHGSACHDNCPTCGGKPWQQRDEEVANPMDIGPVSDPVAEFKRVMLEDPDLYNDGEWRAENRRQREALHRKSFAEHLRDAGIPVPLNADERAEYVRTQAGMAKLAKDALRKHQERMDAEIAPIDEISGYSADHTILDETADPGVDEALERHTPQGWMDKRYAADREKKRIHINDMIDPYADPDTNRPDNPPIYDYAWVMAEKSKIAALKANPNRCGANGVEGGWWCSRDNGHDGPCALREGDND